MKMAERGVWSYVWGQRRKERSDPKLNMLFWRALAYHVWAKPGRALRAARSTEAAVWPWQGSGRIVRDLAELSLERTHPSGLVD